MKGRYFFAAIGVYTLISIGPGSAGDEEREWQLELRQQELEWQQQLFEWDAWNARRKMDDLEQRERNRENEWELKRLLERRW